MIITHKLTLALDSREALQSIDGVQGDTVRAVEISLLAQGAAWAVPEGATAMIRYRRVRSGAGGTYDTMPDGAAAYAISEDKVTVYLTPQIFSVPGPVELQVTLICDGAEVTSFSMMVYVQGNLSDATMDEEDYVNLSKHINTSADRAVEEKMPAALPCPNALTINGQSYDGSAPVDLQVAKKEHSVIYVVGDDTSAFGVWTGTSDEIAEYFDGLMIAFKTVASGGSPATTLNINGLGTAAVKRNATLDVNYYYPANSVLLLTYTTTDGVGSWQLTDANIDSDTKNTTGTSNKEDTKMYLIGASARTEIGTKTYTNVNCYIGEDNCLYSGGQKVITDEVPDYVRAEAERLAALVQSRQNANTVSFMLGSDIHARLDMSAGSYTTEQMLESAKHAAQAMKIVRQQVHLDFAGLLGDYLWDNGETAEQAMEMYRIIHEYFAPAFEGLPQFWCKGNHDMLGNEATGVELTDEQIFSAIGIHNSGAVYPAEKKVQGYCYRDFDALNLRVVCLNTCETRNSYAVSSTQNNWLAGVLNLTGKSGWKSIILCHVPLDSWGADAEVLTNVASYSDSVLCVIHGHLHNYLSGVLTGTTIPRLCIPNIDFYRTNEYGENDTGEGTDGYIEYGEEVSYEKTAGTGEDTAFCVITIDLKTGKLYADHYGAGYDREIDLNISSGDEESGSEEEVVSYTNVIRQATTTAGGSEIYGEDYNGDGTADGYITGTRVGSSGTESTAANMCVTGFITASSADTVRIKNITVSGGAAPYLLQYGINGGYLAAMEIPEADADGVICVLPENWIDSNMQTFRLSVGVIDDTSVITINEEIS